MNSIARTKLHMKWTMKVRKWGIKEIKACQMTMLKQKFGYFEIMLRNPVSSASSVKICQPVFWTTQVEIYCVYKYNKGITLKNISKHAMGNIIIWTTSISNRGASFVYIGNLKIAYLKKNLGARKYNMAYYGPFIVRRHKAGRAWNKMYCGILSSWIILL